MLSLVCIQHSSLLVAPSRMHTVSPCNPGIQYNTACRYSLRGLEYCRTAGVSTANHHFGTHLSATSARRYVVVTLLGRDGSPLCLSCLFCVFGRMPSAQVGVNRTGCCGCCAPCVFFLPSSLYLVGDCCILYIQQYIDTYSSILPVVLERNKLYHFLGKF